MTNLPLPSTQVARASTKPTMRFLYPLAAVCVAAVFLAPGTTDAQTSGSVKLRPDQERAIELMLKDVDPAVRPMARQQLAASFAHFTEAQIAMTVARLNETRSEATAAPGPEPEVETVATPEDRVFMKAQMEPVIRKHHAVQKEFDALANKKLETYCPGSSKYARWGSGWRYEQAAFVSPSSLATSSVDSNVQTAEMAYMPQDGRYKFDFSKVRMSFNQAKVEAEIKRICDGVHAAGATFLAELDPLIARKDWDGAFKAEQKANSALEGLRAEWKTMIDTLSPGDFSEIQIALMNGKKVK